mmetsp:Transcript_64870/g.120684  ORF Transcript_64870/g.120684 Transcript_64870/m.120684 type:complete len:175 (-) Transcript_64870:86-610(-)
MAGTDSDRELRDTWLARVPFDPLAFRGAPEDIKNDPEIVLAAINRMPNILEYAGEACRRDPEIVMTAVRESKSSLQHASDELLEDVSFATEARCKCYILKIILISGRHTYCLVFEDYVKTKYLIPTACKRLGLPCKGTERLLIGSDIVPANSSVHDWPGLAPRGEVSEYQLLLE